VFGTWAIARKGTPRGKRSSAALVLVALTALIAAGCGGGSGGESESASKKKLEAAAAKIEGAKSLRMSIGFASEEEGETEELGCLDLSIDTGKPEKVDLAYFDVGCSGGTEVHELKAIGRKAWGTEDLETWRAAKITPALLHELSSEDTDFGKLMEGAEHIEVDPEGGGVEEGNKGKFVAVPKYFFEAPASAFSGSEDLGDLKVEFEATVDRKGFLRELVVHGDEDEVGATVTAQYEDIDQDMGITPPDPKEVEGPAKPIKTRDQLDALFGLSSTP
jgi:hypothetical protein